MVGVSANVLRLWERQGLIAPARTSTGYRLYSLSDVKQLSRIRDLFQRDKLNSAGVRRVLGGDGHQPPRNPAGSLSRSEVGAHLRRLRHRRGQSLRQLSAKTGLSASYISAIERSLSNPSVASLQKLASALDANLLKLMGEEYADDDDLLVVTPAQRKPLDLGIPGVLFETLASIDTELEPMLTRIEPGAGSDDTYAHVGEEFIFVLEGTFEITLEDTRTYMLEVGDAMTFASNRPHRWRNPGSVACVLVWVNTPPTF